MVLARKLAANTVSGKRDKENYFMKDLYVIIENEPCYMCSMAMVHSRIARLYFEGKNSVDGGMKVEINCLRNLNHQFTVYQMLQNPL